MASIQETLHKMEEGSGKRYFTLIPVFLVLAFVIFGYNLRSFRNMSSQEAMDAAQLARNLAAGEGYTTKFIRPLSIHLHERQAEKKAGGKISVGAGDAGQLKRPHTDISNPPVYPVLLAGLMKALPFNYDSLTRRPFWYRNSSFWRHQPDFIIAIFNQLLMVVMLVATWFLARRLFDEEAAWIATLCLLGTELLWRFSVSGLSTTLLMLIMIGVVWFVHLLETEGREPKRSFMGILLLSFVLGVLLGLGGLTRYAFLVMILPVVAFLSIFGGKRRVLMCATVIVAFLLTATPWLVRNIMESGVPFGTATFATIEGTSLFSGHHLQRSLDPNLDVGVITAVRHKLGSNLRTMLQNNVLSFGGVWLAWFFLVGLMVRFKNKAPQRLRIFILMTLPVLLVTQALGTTQLTNDSPKINSENVMVLLLPAIILYGVACFIMLLDSRKWEVPVLRKLVIVAFMLLMSLQLILTLAPPRTRAIAYPPYNPPVIQTVGSWMKPNELIMSDIPWAVAWYGDRQSVWLTLDITDEYYAISDYRKPVKALYLTPVTTDSKFVSDWVRGGDSKWGEFLIESVAQNKVPRDFPLRSAPKGFTPEQLFLTDWERWRAPGASN